MKRLFLLLGLVALSAFAIAQEPAAKLLYADFEKLSKENRPISLRDGQILFDSSDVAYLYEEEPEGDSYYGEIDYQYEYNGRKGDWFSWLYIDEQLMKTVAEECGWFFQMIYQDDEDHYLGRLSLIPSPSPKEKEENL